MAIENKELAVILKLVATQFQSELKKSQGSLGSMSAFILDWRTQLTAAGAALFAIAKSTANFGEEALKTSQRIGLSVQQTTALQYAAHLADVPVRTLETSLKSLSQNAAEAARGSGDGAKVFAALGISATEASGKIKPLDQLLFEFQDRLGGVSNQVEFVDAGVKAFGKSFLEIVPFIRQGSAATREAMEEAKRLGVVLSRDQAQAAARFNDELKRLAASSQGLSYQVGNALIPTLTELITLFREIGVGTGISAGLQLIANHLIRLSVLAKELQANWQFLTGRGDQALSFEGLKQRIEEIEAEGRNRLFALRHPGVATSPGLAGSRDGLSGGGLSLAGADRGREQERLAKALQEIWQTNIRSAAIHEKQLDEVFAQWDERARFFEAMAAREADAEERRAAGVQALREFAEAEFQRDDEMLAHAAEVQQRRAQMIVDSTQLEIRLRDQALAEQLAANRTFFDGWAEGMRKYVQDTESGFGFAADMARRTAQTMEQGFRTFFFDLLDGQIKTVEDAMRGLLDFVKQIMAQVAAQLVTRQVIGAGLSLFGAPALGAAGGGMVVQRFAMGGPVLGSGVSDTVPALLTPGEFVLSRRDVQEIKSGMAGGEGGVSIEIHNYSRSQAQATDGGRGPDGKRMIYVTVRDAVRGAVDSGDLDASMGRRFGVSPSPGRR